MSLPVVAIVGRPNVGKSTLFNRLAGNRIAIIEDEPGITRDRIYSQSDWNGRQFHLVDTGGLEFDEKGAFLDQIRYQVELAVEEADVILFIVDGREGLIRSDEEVAYFLRRSQKPVIVVVNKMDHVKHKEELYSFYQLGFKTVVPISSAHGIGIGDLLDLIVDRFPIVQEEDSENDVLRIAIIGRPNVGKSSLLNSLLGEERVIVSPIAGTTRDAVDTFFTYEDQSLVFIDTAGVRRRGKVYGSVEKYSVIRTLRAIERSDVSLIVLDGHEGITEQDKKIAGLAHQSGRAAIFVVNKWDIVKKDDKTMDSFKKKVRNHFQFMNYAPILFVSATTKRHVPKIFPMVLEVAEQHAMRISTSILNQVIQDAIMISPPPQDKGVNLRIFYTTQVSVKPPTFVLFVNHPDIVHFSYLRYLENKLREAFPFKGTPLQIILRKKSS
jgi:GTPase